jgi:hypothetical protein
MQFTSIIFSNHLKNEPLLRQGFFLAAAFISIALVGYHYGGFDQSVHIPFLKEWADPSLYPNDPFLALGKDQFSFFWYFFLPFLKMGILEPVIFLTHLLTTTLFFRAIWELSMTLFGEPLAATFAVLSFVFPHTGFTGFPVIEFSLQSRTFVLPFLIIACNLFLRERYGLAFLLLGLMYNLNLLMTSFVLAIIVFCSLIEIRKVGLKKLIISMGMFLLGALPVLIWKVSSGTGLDLSLRPEWFSAITQGVLFQVFYLFSDKVFLLLTFGGLSSIALFFIARRFKPSCEHNKSIMLFMVAIMGILLVQLATTLWLPITFIVQMQLSRASIFILIFTNIYFSGYLAKEFLSKEITGGNIILLAGSLFLFLSPAIPLIAWGIYRKYPNFLKNRNLMAVFILAILLAFSSLGFFVMNLWKPGIQIYTSPSGWVDVANWARKNTAKEAMFITPPQEVGMYQPDWRVFSERGTVVTLYDLFEIALKPDYYSIWKLRFESLAPGALGQFRGNFFENREITRRAFYSLNTTQLLKIACLYQASYLVLEAYKEIKMPAIYENSQYKVIDLRNLLCNYI